MDPAKKKQLDELRAMRSQVVAGLRERLKLLQDSRRFKHPSNPLDHVETLLAALISLQETQEQLEKWDQYEKEQPDEQ